MYTTTLRLHLILPILLPVQLAVKLPKSAALSELGRAKPDSGLQQGAVYRALVTAVQAGRVEILLGNRYLRANTSLQFRQGDVIWLQLAERDESSLVFRLTLPVAGSQDPAGQAQQKAAAATLAQAARLPDRPANIQALLLLQQNSLAFNRMQIEELAWLIAELGYPAALECVPLLKRAHQFGLKVPGALLSWFVYLASETGLRNGEPGQSHWTAGKQAEQPIPLDSSGMELITRRMLNLAMAGSSEDLRKHLQLVLGMPPGVAPYSTARALSAATVFYNELFPEQTTVLLPLRLLKRRGWLRLQYMETGQSLFGRFWLLRLSLRLADMNCSLDLRASQPEASADLCLGIGEPLKLWQQEAPELAARLQAILGMKVGLQLYQLRTPDPTSHPSQALADTAAVELDLESQIRVTGCRATAGLEIVERVPTLALRAAATFLASCFSMRLAAESLALGQSTPLAPAL